MAKEIKTILTVRQAKTLHGMKRGGKKLGFYFGIDDIPKELRKSVEVVAKITGETMIEVECIESGALQATTIELPFGAFVAYEPDDRCPHGFNCWQKTNAPETVVKTEDGYFAKGEEVECCITANGSLPWFLTDAMAPELRILGNEIEVKGSNGIWQRGTIGNSFFVYYNREENGIHDVAIVDADTDAAKVYDAIISAANNTVIYFPICNLIGSVAA